MLVREKFIPSPQARRQVSAHVSFTIWYTAWSNATNRAGSAIRLKGWSLGPQILKGPQNQIEYFLPTVINVNRGFWSERAQQQRPVNEEQWIRGVPDIKQCLLSY